MCLHVGTQHGIHAREMALPLFLEPFENIRVDAKVDRGFTSRHHKCGHFSKNADSGAELPARRLDFGSRRRKLFS
jgi:hypothetical protein